MTVTEKKIVNMLRRYIQDTPVANVLTGKPENRDEDLLLFIRMALDDFNITPPLLTPYTTENFPSMNLLLSGAVVQMLLSNFILQTRNQFQAKPHLLLNIQMPHHTWKIGIHKIGHTSQYFPFCPHGMLPYSCSRFPVRIHLHRAVLLH